MTSARVTSDRRGRTVTTIFVIGRGKVGSSLARALRATGVPVSTIAARGELPKRAPAGPIVIASRDSAIGPIAVRMAEAWSDALKGRAVVHCAGARDPSELQALQARGAAVGQMHPLISFVDGATPRLPGGTLLARGDPAAIRFIRSVGRRLGMRVVLAPELDGVLYHLAAALLANGAAALAGKSLELMARAGLDERAATQGLAALLGSVAHNLSAVGLPEALSGPVRRGDRLAVATQLDRLRATDRAAERLYAALVSAQLPLAGRLGDATTADLQAIEALCRRSSDTKRH